ncbi:enoyl-CoA hydratase/isomerase family protein [Aeromicrobium wangtongii]|uniref:Enoyl-CoA hydratase-related protein n=1 Tax=Aeromicrobium wangtongii TaxID=2969247 RepID=A0ABY5M9C1_9ACTN|nr:enoyl-CoA hydratase-related protein [Aeromicrobium wangtongii]MCD9198696.1 enoyl-CoA hydratase-related protein [Aeromicrobium wangtongii]UUP13258.1 enoyl-CoA hydratase-related protein [Aeromicrobium wangtongii]
MTEVVHEILDQVMHVTLDGADTMNSISPQVVAGLNDVLAVAETDPSLRAVVITGAGEKAFSVGMDITFLGSCFDDPQGTFLPFLQTFHTVLQRIEALPVPVIARVNGLARAGGFELILACDFVIAADEARVGDIHLEFGMPPGAGSSQRAARKLGDQKAKALMLTPLWLDGPSLVRWGLALSSAPRAGLDAEVENLLSSLRGRSRPAIAITKAAINAAQQLPLADGLRHELELFGRLHEIAPVEAREGYQAFVDRRTPSWGDFDVTELR